MYVIKQTDNIASYTTISFKINYTEWDSNNRNSMNVNPVMTETGLFLQYIFY